jgi:hypothetical protein
VPFDLALIGDADVDFQKLLTKVSMNFSYFVPDLMQKFAEEIGWERGLKPPPGLPEKPRILEYFQWIKEAYNYEITLMMHFNPKSVIQTIDWNETLKRVKQLEKDVAHAFTLREEKRKEKGKTLEDIIMSRLEFLDHERQFMENFVSSFQKYTASSEEELLARALRIL